jgi:hypothetical protein
VRQTVVEVVRYDARSRESFVFSAWEGRTDWYRNIQAAPALRVETGRQRYVPVQRFLAPEEVCRELAAYVRRHPWLARNVLARLIGLEVDDSEAGLRRAAAFFRGVSFRPPRAVAPPGPQ